MTSIWTDTTHRKTAILLFIILILAIGALVTWVVVDRSQNLHVTFVFKRLDNLKAGNSVRLSGADMGQVQSLRLIRGDSAQVDVVVFQEHCTLISSGCTARIENENGSLIFNPSGLKVLSIYNCNESGNPPKDRAVIRGVDSWLELQAWYLGCAASGAIEFFTGDSGQ